MSNQVNEIRKNILDTSGEKICSDTNVQEQGNSNNLEDSGYEDGLDLEGNSDCDSKSS